ncbi:protein Shroom isoform X2 [Sitodiplosis mosellana]|uniref:protein Shroom isoform X2 n=1 Tax=Sitodiplosis mosellana TaxID=263140 RepID=UPI00244434EE|nr:protein Shroom isoform X2 [Sitodiplosis mosellana]
MLNRKAITATFRARTQRQQHHFSIGSAPHLIAHSSRVRVHRSESALYMSDDQILSAKSNNIKTEGESEQSSRNNHRLFPVDTYRETNTSPEPKLFHNNQQSDKPPIRSPNGQNWQSVADRINELERQNQNSNISNKSITNNQKYTYLDPAKTTRVPNMTLKAFQKNAVQSYFERQQQQQQQQISPLKDKCTSQQTAKLNSSHMVNGTNGSIAYENNVKYGATRNSNEISSNGTSVIRPQSLPTNKVSISMELIPQTRLSLPNKLSQIINLTTQLSAQKQASNGSVSLLQRQGDRINSPVKSPANQTYTTIPVDKNHLQSINESGVPPPPPPPRRVNVMPVRRTSSAAEYSAYRDQNVLKQHFSNDLRGAVVMGPIISLDEWIPERPPKNPSLRVPSPDLPPPPSPLANNQCNLIIEHQDDPLPPPPPEILRQTSDPENKLNTANRRNSFAGQPTTRKPFIKANNFENLSPPLLPRKPNSTDLFNPRPFSSMRQPHGFQVKKAILQTQQAIKAKNKVIMNGRLEQPIVNRTPSNENRASMRMRKRSHNALMSVATTDDSNRIGSNSKASYLPRQSHEKLTSDPDHGSYKLTLNSNEDSIHLPHFNDQLHATKINNLPDVLPLGVKMKSVSTTRYGSNTTLNNGNNGDVSNSVINNEKLNHHRHHHHGNNIGSFPNGKMNAMMNSTKYISQSTIDLKRAHHLFNNSVCARITNTESLGNLLDCSNHRQSSTPNLQPLISHTNEHRAQITGTNLTVSQHNAMNTNGLVQPPLQPHNDKGNTIRCNDIMDSLLSARDQDAKISQLQNKLLSSQRIHHANIAEINDEDAFNDCLSTDDSSSVSQLSSESISSVELNGDQNYKESPNQKPTIVIKSDAKDDKHNDGDSSQLADDVAAIKLNEMATLEVGSQTDESISDENNGCMSTNGIDAGGTMQPRTKTEIVIQTKLTDEFDCKKLTESLVEQLLPNDRLRNILAPKVYKSTSDYVTGLYNPKMASRSTKKDAGTSMHREQHLDLTENTPLNGSSFSMNDSNHPIFSRHVNGSRFNRDVQLINGDVCDLTKQKEELVIRLTKQLVALTNDRTIITDQNTTNDLLGTDISSIVAQKVRPSEASKFRSHVDDVGHITMLLLSLSARLARIENSLFNMSDATEKKTLEGKRVRLLEQLDEAKRLKIDIDRRGKLIAQILEKNLTPKEYADYDYFINSKAKLIVNLREITDRIQQSEEQLNALKETLLHSEC